MERVNGKTWKLSGPFFLFHKAIFTEIKDFLVIGTAKKKREILLGYMYKQATKTSISDSLTQAGHEKVTAPMNLQQVSEIHLYS